MEQNRTTLYQQDSLTLSGIVMLGTGVMIGTGIFALTAQMAQITGSLFSLAFLAAAIIVSFSVYSSIKILYSDLLPLQWSNEFTSSRQQVTRSSKKIRLHTNIDNNITSCRDML